MWGSILFGTAFGLTLSVVILPVLRTMHLPSGKGHWATVPMDSVPLNPIKKPEEEIFNLLTPNVNYSGRTAPLTSKAAFYVFIQQI